MPSPMGRPYELVEGNQEDIRARGRQINRLSGFLLESADVIDRLAADGASVQEGRAIDRIVEAGSEVVGRFRKIGEWYDEVAPHVRQYGRAVRDAQEQMSPVLDELAHVRRSLAEERDRLQELEDRLAGTDAASSDAPAPERDRLEAEVAEQRELVARLRAQRDEIGARFDTIYTQWEDQFEASADGISQANDDYGLRDRRRGFVTELVAVATPLPAVSLGVFGFVTCIGRGPRPTAQPVAAPVAQYRALQAGPGLARIWEALQARDRAQLASWSIQS
jgi:hypothetical protein